MVRFTALNKKNDFFRLKKETNCFTEKGLRVYIEKNQEKVSRLGISISSKQTTAVERNKFKRRIKEFKRRFRYPIGISTMVIFYSIRLSKSDIFKCSATKGK